jgi:transposase
MLHGGRDVAAVALPGDVRVRQAGQSGAVRDLGDLAAGAGLERAGRDPRPLRKHADPVQQDRLHGAGGQARGLLLLLATMHFTQGAQRTPRVLQLVGPVLEWVALFPDQIVKDLDPPQLERVAQRLVDLGADSRCRPLAFVLTPGQAGDAPAFPEVMARLRMTRPVGRPRTTPEIVLADKAYSSRAIRAHLRQRGIRAVIPQPADQVAKRKKRGRSGGRPPAFDREAYKQRNTVERCINKLKQWRGLATRYDETATVYLAGLHIAGIFIWSDRWLGGAATLPGRA